MEGIFGIGLPEILLIVILALIILGPEDMVGASRKLGRWVYRVVRSPMWKEIMTTSRELRDLPVKLVREAGLEETVAEIKQTEKQVRSEMNEATRQVSADLKEAGKEATAVVNEAQATMDEGKEEEEHSIARPTLPEPEEELADDIPLGGLALPGIAQVNNGAAPPAVEVSTTPIESITPAPDGAAPQAVEEVPASGAQPARPEKPSENNL